MPSPPPMASDYGFYEVLGVSRNATKDEIKKAYRKAALRTHPDRAPPDQKKAQEDAFRAVNAAYEILSSDNKTLYDKYGTWPPPQPQQAARQQYQSTSQDYQPASNVPLFYDHGRPHAPFAFTDPFTLFNAIFNELSNNMQAQAAFHARQQQGHPPNPMFQDPFAYMQFPSFGQAAPVGSFSTGQNNTKPRPRHSSTTPPASAGYPQPSSSDEEGRGWIKESRVTKMTPTGLKETTVKKTAFDGTCYITRIGYDGVERHWVTIDGVEKSSPTGAPAIPPRIPLSQTQAQAQAHPATSTQHRSQPSVPTYMASGPPPPPKEHSSHARSQSHSQPQTSSAPQSRSSSQRTARGPIVESDYRVSSPTPMEQAGKGAAATAGYPLAYAKASTATAQPTDRSTTPTQPVYRTSTPVADPKQRERTQSEAPRRHHTAPAQVSQPPPVVAPLQPQSTYQAAQPPTAAAATAAATGSTMPRPQSPHFYRTRVSPEKAPAQAHVPHHASTKPTKSSHLAGSSSRREVREDPSAYPFSDSETRTRSTIRGVPVSSGYQSASAAAATIQRSTSTRPSRSAHTAPARDDRYAPAVPAVPTMSSSRTAAAPTQQQSQQQPKVASAVPPRVQAVQQQEQPRKSSRSHPPVIIQQQQQQPIPMVVDNSLGLGFVPPPAPTGGVTLATGNTPAAPTRPFGEHSRSSSFEHIVYPGATKGMPHMAYGNPMPNPPQMDQWGHQIHHHQHPGQWQRV
ncbi:hypothetical protein FRB94_012657 [Tulasnella sp. JGI-2019a]|nr:hypothetical protein FRB94_012657 [Tulasnella sp. JGI-2019a]